jgi:hypothetical protein
MKYHHLFVYGVRENRMVEREYADIQKKYEANKLNKQRLNNPPNQTVVMQQKMNGNTGNRVLNTTASQLLPNNQRRNNGNKVLNNTASPLPPNNQRSNYNRN